MGWFSSRSDDECTCAGCSHCDGYTHKGEGFCEDCHKAAIRDAKADQAREDEKKNGGWL